MDIKELLDAYKQLDSMEDPTGMNEEKVDEAEEKDSFLGDGKQIHSEMLDFGIAIKKDQHERVRLSAIMYGGTAKYLKTQNLDAVVEIVKKHVEAMEQEIAELD